MNNRGNLILLRILLVTSMIGSGLYLTSYLGLGLMLPFYRAEMANPDSIIHSLLPDEAVLMVEQMLEIPQGTYLLMALLYALSLTGVIMMWLRRVPGLHCYAMAQILVLIVQLLFLGKAYVGLGDVMLTAMYIAFYYILFRRLGYFSPTPPSDGEQPS